MSRRRAQPKAEDIPSPDSLSTEQALCLVGQSRGSSIFEVKNVTGRLLLAELPPKFRKNVWVRRGSYVIVALSNDTTTAKVVGEIEHVVSTDQVKEWKRKGVWPSAFDVNESANTSDALQAEPIIAVDEEGAAESTHQDIAQPLETVASPYDETATNSSRPEGPVTDH